MNKSYLLIALLFSACGKLIDPGTPTNKLTSEIIFSNDSLARLAVSGIYFQMGENEGTIFNGGTTLFASLCADDLITPLNINNEGSYFYTNTLYPNMSAIRDRFWVPAYKNVYQCNSAIESLTKYSGVNPNLKNRLIGEAKFLRAFCYYYLANFFGDVPLVLTTDYKVSAGIPRTPAPKIYEQILEDLKSAEESVSLNFNSYVTIYTCEALLARVYLKLERWEESELHSSRLINSHRFQLEENLDRVFLPASGETIFQLQPVMKDINTVEGNLFIPKAYAEPNFYFSSSLINAFEPGDLRKAHWTKELNLSKTYTIPYKYKINYAPLSLGEYNVVLRLAEQYLIRAEALARQGNISGAVDDLNAIRKRAGLSALSASLTLNECVNAIAKERRTELFAEWGHRWFDLKRTGFADVILSKAKGSNWQPTDELFPIPNVEIILNRKLTQNPGY
jgi:starch-binding outer membrane protein, SusD/RagB family